MVACCGILNQWYIYGKFLYGFLGWKRIISPRSSPGEEVFFIEQVELKISVIVVYIWPFLGLWNCVGWDQLADLIIYTTYDHLKHDCIFDSKYNPCWSQVRSNFKKTWSETNKNDQNILEVFPSDLINVQFISKLYFPHVSIIITT